MINHSCSTRDSSTREAIRAESIPNLQTVCKIIPVQVMLLFSVLVIRMAELYAAIPHPNET